MGPAAHHQQAETPEAEFNIKGKESFIHRLFSLKQWQVSASRPISSESPKENHPATLCGLSARVTRNLFSHPKAPSFKKNAGVLAGFQSLSGFPHFSESASRLCKLPARSGHCPLVRLAKHDPLSAAPVAYGWGRDSGLVTWTQGFQGPLAHASSPATLPAQRLLCSWLDRLAQHWDRGPGMFLGHVVSRSWQPRELELPPPARLPWPK